MPTSTTEEHEKLEKDNTNKIQMRTNAKLNKERSALALNNER